MTLLKKIFFSPSDLTEESKKISFFASAIFLLLYLASAILEINFAPKEFLNDFYSLSFDRISVSFLKLSAYSSGALLLNVFIWGVVFVFFIRFSSKVKKIYFFIFLSFIAPAVLLTAILTLKEIKPVMLALSFSFLFFWGWFFLKEKKLLSDFFKILFLLYIILAVSNIAWLPAGFFKSKALFSALKIFFSFWFIVSFASSIRIFAKEKIIRVIISLLGSAAFSIGIIYIFKKAGFIDSLFFTLSAFYF